MLHDKNISLYEKHKVYSETEIKAHYEIKNEKYCKYLNIEVLTMIDMAKKDILPCVSRNIHELADTVIAKRSVSSTINVSYEEELVETLSRLSAKVFQDVKNLEYLSQEVKSIEESDAAACFYKHNIIPVMESMRDSVDLMETLCSSEHWCYPSYGELLFSVR
jgi:glutamine synthetase